MCVLVVFGEIFLEVFLLMVLVFLLFILLINFRLVFSDFVFVILVLDLGFLLIVEVVLVVICELWDFKYCFICFFVISFFEKYGVFRWFMLSVLVLFFVVMFVFLLVFVVYII